MAEIKSAIELALEKTKGLSLSREEKERIKEEEMQAKAHGLVHRFLQVDFHLREVEKELAKYDPAERAQLETLIIQFLTEAIQLDHDDELIFQGIESFRGESKNITGKIKELMADYRKQKEKEGQRVEKDLRTKLKRQGISGSAVQPQMEGSREWEDALTQFKPTFESRLRALKEALPK